MTNEILPAVAAMIFNRKGEVLLQQRVDTKKWCVISGHVEFGETVEEAMLREIREEAFVESKIVRLIGVYSSPQHTTYHYPDRSVQYVVTYFEVQLLNEISGNFRNSETEAFGWFSSDNLPGDLDMMNPHWLSDGLCNGVFIR